jgi:hypothetical protein
LAFPLLGWSQPAAANDSTQIRDEVKLRNGQEGWQYFEGVQTNFLGGDAYWLQCGFSDDLQPLSFNEGVEHNGIPLLPIIQGTTTKLPLAYEMRVFCETGSELSDEGKQELIRFFEVLRSAFRKNLPARQLERERILPK